MGNFIEQVSEPMITAGETSQMRHHVEDTHFPGGVSTNRCGG